MHTIVARLAIPLMIAGLLPLAGCGDVDRRNQDVLRSWQTEGVNEGVKSLEVWGLSADASETSKELLLFLTEFDSSGRVTRAVDLDRRTKSVYRYDENGRLVQRVTYRLRVRRDDTFREDTVAAVDTVSYVYETGPNGNLIGIQQRTAATGNAISWRRMFDPDGHILLDSSFAADGHPTSFSVFSYSMLGEYTKTGYRLDDRGRIERDSGTVSEYYRNGQMSALEVQGNDGVRVTYEYDGDDRLIFQRWVPNKTGSMPVIERKCLYAEDDRDNWVTRWTYSRRLGDGVSTWTLLGIERRVLKYWD